MSHEPIPVLILGYTHVSGALPLLSIPGIQNINTSAIAGKNTKRKLHGVFFLKWEKLHGENTKSPKVTTVGPVFQCSDAAPLKPGSQAGPCFSPWSWSSLEVADTRNKIQRAYSTNHHVNLNDNKPAIIVIETIMMMMMMIMMMMMMMMLVVVVMVVVVMVVAVVEMGDELFYDSLWHWKAIE